MELKKMIWETTPTDYGIDRYIWTGKIISEVLEQSWGGDKEVYEIDCIRVAARIPCW